MTITSSSSPVKTSFEDIIPHKSLFMFDAYGVLVDGAGPKGNSKNALRLLQEEKKPFYLVTNDASKGIEQQVEKYRRYDLPFDESNIITSGMLVTDYFVENDLAGTKCLVMGAKESFGYIEQGKGEILDFSIQAEPEVIVIMDDTSDFPLSQSLEILISVTLSQIEKGSPPRLILANPDLLYPTSQKTFALAAGSLANMLEEIISIKYPGQETLQFTRVGKPFSPIFEKVLNKHPKLDPIFFGDQPATDILGANRCKIDSALVLSGIASLDSLSKAPLEQQPTFILEAI